MIGRAAAAIILMGCMAWSSGALADCTSGIVPERLSCLNQELEALKAQSGREIAGLKADIQMLRNQLLGLKQIIDALPPAASIVRLDDDMNVLWEQCLVGAAGRVPHLDRAGVRRARSGWRRLVAGVCALQQSPEPR